MTDHDDDDFWGPLPQISVSAPVSFLKEQARKLERHTNSDLYAYVDTTPQGNRFVHTFNIVARELNGYTFELFTVRHSLDFYPLEGVINGIPEILHSEDEFLAWIKKTLKSDRTQRILESLLSQVRAR